MQIIDLTHTIHDDMQIYPGDPSPSIRRGLTHEKDYCHVDLLTLGSHTGTHIDAPYHFLKDGLKIDEIPVHRFVGKGILVDVSDKSDGDLIDAADIEPCVSTIRKGEFVILKTGWDRYFGTPQYLQHPFLSVDAGLLLLDLDVSLVGIDALNVDASYPPVMDRDSLDTGGGVTADDNYPIHGILLGNDILIVENLCNLDKIDQKFGFYSFLPLKLKESDGSPIRAVFYSK
jgi:kynurenine formamidase